MTILRDSSGFFGILWDSDGIFFGGGGIVGDSCESDKNPHQLNSF